MLSNGKLVCLNSIKILQALFSCILLRMYMHIFIHQYCIFVRQGTLYLAESQLGFVLGHSK